jgi:tRNA threonylcarbamoyladenosine biosynthesis protein TsaE
MPILDSRSLDFISRSAEQTRRIGMRLGALLQTGDLVGLNGNLGAGKTTLMQGIAQGWGSIDQVTSPTFVLVNVYRRPDGSTLYHMDAYRLKNAVEACDLDIDLMLSTGALVVEWGDRVEAALPRERLWVNMHWMADEQRNLVFLPHGSHYEKLVTDFRRQTFGS